MKLRSRRICPGQRGHSIHGDSTVITTDRGLDGDVYLPFTTMEVHVAIVVIALLLAFGI